MYQASRIRTLFTMFLKVVLKFDTKSKSLTIQFKVTEHYFTVQLLQYYASIKHLDVDFELKAID